MCEGVLLWNASLVLKRYLEEKARGEFAGATVLELGRPRRNYRFRLASRQRAHDALLRSCVHIISLQHVTHAELLWAGAGAGHLSLAVCRMGARVTSTEAKCKQVSIFS